MPNRSHRNAGHRAMNGLRRDGKKHRSELQLPPPPERTVHRLIHADVVEGLRQLPTDSIQLILCDPPYNLELADWDKFDNYLEWAKLWLGECHRVLARQGSLVLFGGLQFQGARGGDLLELMHFVRHQLSLRLVNLIIWNYPNGMSAHRFFANRHEEVAWYAKGSDYLFNLDEVREPFDEETKSRYSRDKRLRAESIEKGKNPGNVWRIGRLNGNSKERTGHPTQKPRAIYERLIRALSHPGHVVLDPFAGSGVAARVAIEWGRHSVSVDSSDELRQHVRKQLIDLPPDGTPFTIE
ncbi:MAG: site-specific DNA-methyltransferase [Planctomycetota bacterium]